MRRVGGATALTRIDETSSSANWLKTLRRYLIFVSVAHLIWEFAHLPLYSIWITGSPNDLVFAAIHCAGGDVLIALTSTMFALMLAGDRTWPIGRNKAVIASSVAIGLSYTVFSEWLNIEIRESWAYRDIMPTLPFLGTGLSPVVQWVAVPLVGYHWAIGKARQNSPPA